MKNQKSQSSEVKNSSNSQKSAENYELMKFIAEKMTVPQNVFSFDYQVEITKLLTKSLPEKERIDQESTAITFSKVDENQIMEEMEKINPISFIPDGFEDYNPYEIKTTEICNFPVDNHETNTKKTVKGKKKKKKKEKSQTTNSKKNVKRIKKFVPPRRIKPKIFPKITPPQIDVEDLSKPSPYSKNISSSHEHDDFVPKKREFVTGRIMEEKERRGKRKRPADQYRGRMAPDIRRMAPDIQNDGVFDPAKSVLRALNTPNFAKGNVDGESDEEERSPVRRKKNLKRKRPKFETPFANRSSSEPPKKKAKVSKKKNKKKGEVELDDKVLEIFAERGILEIPEEVLQCNPAFVNHILLQITKSTNVTFDDIGGLEDIKRDLQTTIINPLFFPNLCRGLNSMERGLLFYGPPGTGKTLLAKAIAHCAKATFFSMTASSLTSKWVGESEKIVKTLFVLARALQPTIIFIDEIDSILGRRGSEDSASGIRRLKTEFLTSTDGTSGSENDRFCLIGATNLPWEIDDAIMRRLPSKFFISLPNAFNRTVILKKIIESYQKDNQFNVSDEELDLIAKKTERFSGSDLKGLLKQSANLNFQSWEGNKFLNDLRRNIITEEELREKYPQKPITYEQILLALKKVKATVSIDQLRKHKKYDSSRGSDFS